MTPKREKELIIKALKELGINYVGDEPLDSIKDIKRLIEINKNLYEELEYQINNAKEMLEIQQEKLNTLDNLLHQTNVEIYKDLNPNLDIF